MNKRKKAHSPTSDGMNSAHKTLLDRAVSEAADVANFNAATHTRHSEQLADAVLRALDHLGRNELDPELASAWHAYKTDDDSRVLYYLEFVCDLTADLPKSPSQIREACRSAGMRVKGVDYDTKTQQYHVVVEVTGQEAARRSRRLRDENPDFRLDDSAVPPKVARMLKTETLDPEVTEQAGIARAPAVPFMTISSKNRFRQRRRSPKKCAKKKSEKTETQRPSWFSFSYWFGGSGNEDNEIVEAYKDDQNLFVY